MAEIDPSLFGVYQVIGAPGAGYERPDDPPLPYVVLSGDEVLHLVALAQVKKASVDLALPGHTAELGQQVDPKCPICASLFGEGGKLPELLAAAEERRP